MRLILSIRPKDIKATHNVLFQKISIHLPPLPDGRVFGLNPSPMWKFPLSNSTSAKQNLRFSVNFSLYRI